MASMSNPVAPRIGVWGTFDLDNFGDVLYPRIVARALERRLPEADLRFMSPLGPGNTKHFDPGQPVEGLGRPTDGRLEELAGELDCVAVGGGDIIHFRDEGYAPHYGVEPASMRDLAPGRFFVEGLGAEREHGSPVVWNAVGVPIDFTAQEAARVRSALEGRPYLAVRDEQSRRRLVEAGVDRDLEVVPDQAMLLPDLMPLEDLRSRLDHLRLLDWYPMTGPALVVQANRTLLPHADAVAEALRRIVEARPGLAVVFVEPGAVHGDAEFATAVAGALPFRTHRLPAASGMEDLVAAIAWSAGFIGSSLHGFIAAHAYGRPAVALHLNDFSKIPGFAELAGRSHCIVASPLEIPPAFDRAEGDLPDRGALSSLQGRVELHFDRIAEIAEKAAALRAPTRSEDDHRAAARRVAALARAAEEVLARAAAERRVVDAAVWDLQEDLAEVWADANSPLGILVRRLRRRLSGLAPLGTRRRSFLATPLRAVRLVVKEGWGAFLLHLPKVHRWVPRMWRRALPDPDRHAHGVEYAIWQRLHRLRPRDLRRMRRAQATWAHRPLISIITPTYNSNVEWLRAALDSVLAQTYPNWEHCVADDASPNSQTRQVLAEYAARDPRFRVTHREANGGIVEASNTALDAARGEFVAFLDHDDELQPHALFEVVRLLNERPDLDYVYTDQDKMEPDGRRVEAFFKPDWSPDLLMSMNYLTHLSVYRRELVERLGRLRPGYEGSQDYDLVLRVTEATDRIGHVPKPLYSWRKSPVSAAGSSEAKPWAYEAAKRALADALRRRGQDGEVDEGAVQGCYRVRYRIRGEPRVAVVIADPAGETGAATAHAVRELSAYPSVEVLVVGPRAEGLEDDVRYVRPEGAGRAGLLDAGAAATDAELLLFLEPGLEPVGGEWITSLVEHAQRPEVGVVGGRLFAPTGQPLHEGMVLGVGGRPATPIIFDGYLEQFAVAVRNCSAVQLGALMLRREVLDEVGGFAPAPDDWADMDLCRRARDRGYRVVYTPYAALRYARPVAGRQSSRSADGTLGSEPFYNPNLATDRPFGLRLHRS